MVEDTTFIRKVIVGTPLYNPSGFEPLLIPADEIVDFSQKSFTMENDKSFIAIMPHMHLLGKSYKIWVKTEDGDSIPLIDIPVWDFHWQYFYTFPVIQKVPEGARFYASAWYDSTSDNPNNPNHPPVTVYEGSYTSDEMLMTFMAYTEYMEGDEFIVIDSSFLNPANISDHLPKNIINIYPNPVQSLVEFK